jgi:hypothetical protein
VLEDGRDRRDLAADVCGPHVRGSAVDVYGFVIWSLPVLIFSAVGLLLCATILILKVRGSRGASAEAAKQLA